MPLAMKTDIIDQILAMALHPAYDCYTAKVSVDVLLNLTQCPLTHAYIVRREVVENMLEICGQSPQSEQERKDNAVILRYMCMSLPYRYLSVSNRVCLFS